MAGPGARPARRLPRCRPIDEDDVRDVPDAAYARRAGFTSLMEVPVTGGVPVLLRVGAFDDASGTGTLTLTLAACVSDLDGSGAVDIGDLLQILTDWGPCE